jgi:hypothetical protein
VQSGLNLDLPEDRRGAIEALLQGVKVRTIGKGRQKRAELTFYWLGQEPYIPLDLKALSGTPAGIPNDANLPEDS